MPAVLTITPNPSLDLLFEADRLVWDDANRVAAPRRRSGGQGLNVARVVRALGGEAAAVALLGGVTGDELQSILAAEGVPLRRVTIPGETRWFVSAREVATGRSLLLNPRGPACGEAEAAALLEAVAAAVTEMRPAWLACCGSLPPGLPPDSYARMVRIARSAGARVVADTDGEALRLAAAAGCDLLVPNRHEAERLTGRSIAGVEGAVTAARAILDSGAAKVAVTLGEEGAVAADATGAWHAAAPASHAGSAVAAGDAFLAAWLLADLDGHGTPDLLRRGVAAGTAALASRGSAIVERADFEAMMEVVWVREVR